MTMGSDNTTTGNCTLDAAQVGHRFGPRILFRELSFHLESGQSLAVTGANGSGKSTLLRILAGLLAPSRGHVELRVRTVPGSGSGSGAVGTGSGSAFGVVGSGLGSLGPGFDSGSSDSGLLADGPPVAVDPDLLSPPIEKALMPLHCGFVAPYMSVYGGLSARENLDFIGRARRLAGGPERAVALLEAVGLTARADDPVATFSSGMVQRMKLACALLPEPELLLLDEPTVTLDAAGHAVVHRAMENQLARGGMVVLATNVAAEAALCADRLELA